MRVTWLWPTLLIILCTIMVGCNDGRYSNPTSPPATTTEWRTMTVDESGGSFTFSDIGAFVTFPVGAIPAGETHTFRIRLFPPGIPLLPTGPVFIRLGSFEFGGPDVLFNELVEVRFRIADERDPGLVLRGYKLEEDERTWEFYQNAPVVDGDGSYSVMHVAEPGIYGAFQFIHLHVEAAVNQQQGPIPLTAAFTAIITGGHPPYTVIWHFGDNSDPEGGVSVAHAYVDPGVYNVACMVSDKDGNWVSDSLTVTAYLQPGGPTLP